MLVRTLTPALCSKISDLIMAALSDASCDAWSAEKLYADSESATVFVDSMENPQGTVWLRATFESADIHMMAVHPDKHRCGIAHRLLGESFSWCKKNQVNQLILEVAETNKPAVYLYKKHGFQEIHRRPNYYKRSHNQYEDALIFEKHFPH